MSVPIFIILLDETDQPSYFYASTWQNVQNVNNANINEKPWFWLILFSAAKDAIL